MNRTNDHNDRCRRLLEGLRRLWLAALAVSCLAACVRDGADEAPKGGGTDESEAVAWMVFQAAPGQGVATRATDPHGDEEEYALAPGNYHFVLLYKPGSNTPEAVVSLQNPDAIADRPSDGVSKTLVAVYGLKEEQVDDFRNFLKNFEALALLNFDPVQLGLDRTLGDWKNLEPEQIKEKASRNVLKGATTSTGTITVGGTTYYTMSSSVYVNNSEVRYGWETQTNELFESKQRAIAAALNGEANIVTYVERVVAKVVPVFDVDAEDYLVRGEDYSDILFYGGLSSDDDGDDRYDVLTTQRGWKAKLLGYGMNGLEQDTRLFKSLQANGRYWTATTQKPLHDAAKHRSHWGEDLNYTVDGNTVKEYPHQYRTALEVDTLRDYHRTNAQRTGRDFPRLIEQWGYDGTDWIPGWEDEHTWFDAESNTQKSYQFQLHFTTENPDFCLRYVPFNALTERDWHANTKNAEHPEPIYLLENTYADPDNRLSDNGYFTAGTHLLVACQLEIDGVPPGTDIYKDQHDIFYDDMDELLMSKFQLLVNKALPGGNTGLNILHVDWLNHNPEGAYLTTLSWPVDSKLYINRGHGNGFEEWMNESDAWLDLTLIPAELTGGDGQLLIAPRWYNNTFAIGSSPNTAVTITYNQVVSLFHKLVGPIDHYKNGYMYYAAPVGHNDRNSNQWKSSVIGSVGLVRNHAYTLNVNSVSKPGRSVDMVGQPIIPLLDVKRDYIDVSVKILDWHNIIQDNIPMSPTQ